MSKRKKPKRWSRKDFLAKVGGKDWKLIVGHKDLLPEALQGIPEAIIEFVCISGSLTQPAMEPSPLGDGELCGGIDVFRWDQKDQVKGFPINKDHYCVLEVPDEEDLLVIGCPKKNDPEHWLSHVPQQYRVAEHYEDGG